MQLFRSLGPATFRNLLVLFTSSLCFWMSLTALLPTLPTYVSDLGANHAQVGFVMGSFALGLILSRNSLGRLADRRGRKLALLIGVAVVALAPMGYALAGSIAVLALIRSFHGISVAAYTTGYPALVTDLAPPQRKGELLGLMTLAMPLGMTMGPALGGFLQPEIGYQKFFLLTGGLGLLGLVMAAQVREPRKPPAKPGATDTNVPNPSFGQTFATMWQGLTSPRLKTPAIVLLLIGMTFGTLVSFLPLFLRDAGLDLNAGLFYTISAIANFSTRFASGRASDRYGRGIFITASVAIYALSMVLLATATSPAMVMLAAVFQGAGGGTLIPMILALMADRSTADERGRIYSLSFLGHDIGLGLAGPLLGPLAISFGYRGLFGLGALMGFAALVVFLTRSGKDVPESFRFATGRGTDIYAIES